MKKKEKAPKKALGIISKAKSIYAEQKQDFVKMIKTKRKQGKSMSVAAKEASSVYKKMYGSNPTERWKHAMGVAKRGW